MNNTAENTAKEEQKETPAHKQHHHDAREDQGETPAPAPRTDLTVSARDREQAVAAIASRLQYKDGVHIGLRATRSVRIGAQDQPAFLVATEHKDLPDLRKEFAQALEKARAAWPGVTEYDLIESTDYQARREEDSHVHPEISGVFRKARVINSFLLTIPDEDAEAEAKP